MDYETPDNLDFEIPFDPEADISQLRDDLFVGSAFAAQNPDELRARGIECVVTLSESLTFTTTVHAPIRDGQNDDESFAAAVDAVRTAADAETTCLIHCSAGISRAPTLTALALCLNQSRPFEETVAEVRSTHPRMKSHSGLLRNVEVFLNATHGRS